jgi:hypothetical protein
VKLFLAALAVCAWQSMPPAADCKSAPGNLAPEKGAWTSVEWNAKRDCQFSPWMKSNLVLTFDAPAGFRALKGEGFSSITSSDRAASITLEYWGDKRFRQGRKFSGATYPGPHGYSWTDAHREIQYQVGSIKRQWEEETKGHSTKPLEVSPLTLKKIHGMTFWRADVQVPPTDSTPSKHHVVMLSDNGLNLNFESTPVTERIIVSMRKK